MTTAEHYASVQCKSFQAFMAQYNGTRRDWAPMYAFFADIHGIAQPKLGDIRLNPWTSCYQLYYEGHTTILPLPKWACAVLIAIREDDDAL